MKTLCVAVVVLSLLRGCLPASLVCETLTKPLDKSPDVPGRWYLIALSFNSCLLSAIWSFSEPSIHADLSSTDKLNNYDGKFGVKMLGYCKNTTGSLMFTSGTIRVEDVEFSVLLQSGCHDCVVIKNPTQTMLQLYSRRINITAEEMSEFQKQAECLGLNTVKIFSTDHDHENCIPFEDSETQKESPELELLVQQRVENMFRDFTTCVKDSVLSYPRAAYEWVRQKWDNLW